MKPGLQVGHHFEFSIQVQEDMRPQFGEQIIHPLYATASMLNHMEWAARQHVLPYLEPGEESVGYHIDLKHLAATPMGATVRICSTVTQLRTRKVISRVEAWCGAQKIGEGFLTQALVCTHKLYVSAPAQPPAKTITPDGEVPPAALLASDGQQGIQFEILKWETGQFPCSRYDEWLVCQLVASSDSVLKTYKGAFLLRHEIEDWLKACQKLSTGKASHFQSDFLEPVLRIELGLDNAQHCQCILQLTELSNDPQKRMDTQRLEFNLSQQALSHFCTQLIDQLDGFPSRL